MVLVFSFSVTILVQGRERARARARPLSNGRTFGVRSIAPEVVEGRPQDLAGGEPDPRQPGRRGRVYRRELGQAPCPRVCFCFLWMISETLHISKSIS